MANPTAFLGRALFAPVFYLGAQNAINNADGLAQLIDKRREQVGLSGLPVGSKELVQINGAAQIGLSGAMALGIAPRLSALGLIGSLVPTTLAGHAFWEQEDEGEKKNQTLQFVKNLAIVGGLAFIAGAPKK